MVKLLASACSIGGRVIVNSVHRTKTCRVQSASAEFGDIKAFLESIRRSVGSREIYRAETKGNHTLNIPLDVLAQVVQKFFGAMLAVAAETNATYDAFVDGFNYWLKHFEKRINGSYGDNWEDTTTGFVKSGLKQQVAYEMDPKRGKKTIEQHGTQQGSTIHIDDVEEGQAVQEIGVNDAPDLEQVLNRIERHLGREFAEYAEAKFSAESKDPETKRLAKARVKEIEKSVGKERLQNEFLPKLMEFLTESQSH